MVPAPLDTAHYGPAMRALPSDKMRAFVEYLLSTGTVNAKEWTEAARAAGYKDGPGLKVTACRMAHDERILAALHEHGAKTVGALFPLAINALREMLEDKDHRAHFNAVDRVLGQAGLHSKTEIKHRHELSTAEMEAKIRSLAQFLDMDPSKLLGGTGPVIDVTPEVTSETE